MTRDDLLRLIDQEVNKLMSEPIREPVKRNPIPQQIMYEPTLKTDEEIDEILFYGGKKEE